jgi:hypothetical protein
VSWWWWWVCWVHMKIEIIQSLKIQPWKKTVFLPAATQRHPDDTTAHRAERQWNDVGGRGVTINKRKHNSASYSTWRSRMDKTKRAASHSGRTTTIMNLPTCVRLGGNDFMVHDESWKMKEYFFEATPSYVDFYVDLYQALRWVKIVPWPEPNEPKKKAARGREVKNWKFPWKGSE